MSRHRGGMRDDLNVYETSVWVQHPTEGYTPGRILRDVGLAEVEVQAPDGYRSIIRKDQCTPVHRNSLTGVPNLLELGEFTMAALLHNVRVRYNKGEYYSSIGLPILISVNPYRPMPHLYDAPTRRRYQSAQFVSQSPVSSPSSASPTGGGSDDGLADRKLFIDHPHLFGTAQMTYASLMRNNQAQSIVISGESGAGKTEATKILLRYFSELEDNGGASVKSLRRPSMSPLGGSRLPVGLSPTRGGPEGVVSVELHTLRSNPILEAFGNAKTVRNDNSSRFGKFIQIFFDLKNPKRVRSARISHYLLEKCRLVAVYPPERNFHVFYALLFGARDDSRWFRKLETWNLDNPLAFYRILGDDNDWECGSETEMFDELLACLASTGFTEEDVENIFATIAGLLHLSTFDFESVDDPRHAYTAGAPLCRLLNQEALTRTADILKLENVPAGTQGSTPAEALLDVLLFKSVRNAEGQGSWIRSGRDVEQAYHVRDSIIKEVYSRLFSWIVKRVNRALCSKDDNEVSSNRHVSTFRDIKKRGEALSKAVHRNSMSSLSSSQTTQPIGLLDIYGFEVFEGRNSFEQLCINYANEKLQQHFNHHVLALEQKTYKQEDIDWSEIRFTDNKDIIKALEEPPSGVFVILDDTRVTDKNRDTLFLQQLDRCGRKDVVSLPPLKKFKSNVFSVRHYAGDVEYDCSGFVDKNQDKLELQSTFFISRASGSPLLRQLFPVDEFGDMSHRRNSLRATVSLEFRNQLECLLASLTSTTPTYVRCIKPNGRKLPNTFDSLDALRQLEYAGLLESIRIRKSGFGVRCSFAEFLNDYALLRPADFQVWRRKAGLLGENEMKAMCQRLLSVVCTGRVSWQLGRTKVFMKEETQFELEKKRSSVRTESAVLIQSFLRGRKARVQFKRRLAAVVFLQSLYRAKVARYRVAQIRAASRLQRFWKHVRPARILFRRLRLAVSILQRAVRNWLARRRRRFMQHSKCTPVRQVSPRPSKTKVASPCRRVTGDDSTQESLEMPVVVPRLELRRPGPVEVSCPEERNSGRTSTGSHLGKVSRERRRRRHSPPSARNETGNEVLTAFKDLSMQLRKADRLKEGYKREAANLKRQLMKRDDALQMSQKDIDSLTEEIDRRDSDILQLLKERDLGELVNRRLRHQVTCLRNSTDALERIFSDMYEWVEDRGNGMHCEYVQDCLIFMRSICTRSRHTLTRLDHRIRLVSDEAAFPFPIADDQESYAAQLAPSQSSCGFRTCQMRPCDHVSASRAGSLRSSVPFELDRASLLGGRGSPMIDYMANLDYETRSAPRNHHMATMSYDGAHETSSYLPALPSQSGRRRHGDTSRMFPTWRGDETTRSYHERVSSLTLDSAGPASFRETIYSRGKPPRATHHQSPSSCYNNWTSNSLTCRPSAETNRQQGYTETSRQPFHPPTPARQPLDPYLQMGGKPLVSQRLLQKGTLHGAVRPTSSSSNKDGPFASSTSDEREDLGQYLTPKRNTERRSTALQRRQDEAQTFPRGDRHPFTTVPRHR